MKAFRVAVVFAVCVFMSESLMAKGKNDSLSMKNTIIEYVSEGSDIAISFPQLSVPASSTIVMQNLASRINGDACGVIADIAVYNKSNSLAVETSLKIDSPSELEMFVLSEANKSASEGNDLSEPVYQLYSEWNAFANSHIVTIFQKVYSFYGGAHGVTTCKLNNYSAVTGERFSFADIIEDKEGFMKAIVKHFCKDRKLKTTAPRIKTGLDYQLSDLPMPSEIGICKKGIVAIYQQAEIAASYLGVIAVVIPFKDMKDILDKKFFDVKSAKGSIDSYNEKTKVK
ncbi:MAG: hypothetical protein R3Y61_07070 [Rikenellaceae bacterium]